MLRAVEAQGLPVALCYGREDPWIAPLWGHRAKRTLPRAEYWEVTPAGHCPHHEAPEAVNALLLDWLSRQCPSMPHPPCPLSLRPRALRACRLERSSRLRAPPALANDEAQGSVGWAVGVEDDRDEE